MRFLEHTVSPLSFYSYPAVHMYIPMQTDHFPVLVFPLVEDYCPLWPEGEVSTCRTSTVLGRNQLGLDLTKQQKK